MLITISYLGMSIMAAKAGKITSMSSFSSDQGLENWCRPSPPASRHLEAMLRCFIFAFGFPTNEPSTLSYELEILQVLRYALYFILTKITFFSVHRNCMYLKFLRPATCSRCIEMAHRLGCGASCSI